MKRALLFYGGWDGHQPQEVSSRLEGILRKNGFETVRVAGVDCLADEENLRTFDLLVPCVTDSTLPETCSRAVCAAVESGVGLAGCHGGMCDSFRTDTAWQFMTGGQWVAHPGGDKVTYPVHFCSPSPLTQGLADFTVCSEQYYLHVDPAIEVLATTPFFLGGRTVDMPVAWTKAWGKGRVFYSSLGHHDDLFDLCPTAEALMERGMLWASRT